MQSHSATESSTFQPAAKEVKAARAAVGAVFFINGGIFSTWAARIPAVQDKLHLDNGQLGMALLSMGLGALIAMSIAGELSASRGSRPVIVWTMYLSCATLILPAFAPNLLLLVAGVILLTIFLSSLDVSMNAHAVAVEKLYGSPIMSSFHALFSIGGIAGAVLGALFAWQNIGLEANFITSAIALAILGAIMQRSLLPASCDATGARIAASAHFDTLKYLFASPMLLAVSITMFCSFLVEGAIGDWSGVYMRRVLHSDQGFAALGYACYSVTMCTGRFTGDYLIRRFGRLMMLRIGATIAILGLAAVLIPKLAISALIGFSLIGIGVANIVPIGFAAAGNAPGVESGKAIASVCIMGYFGLLIGPPVIGFLAEAVTLPIALWLLAALLMFVIVLSKRAVAAAETVSS